MLPRIMGSANALELLFDPSPRSAEEAEQLGFVQRVLPGDQLLTDVLDYARLLARHSSADSLHMMKRAVLIDAEDDLDAAYRRSVDDMNAALRSASFAPASPRRGHELGPTSSRQRIIRSDDGRDGRIWAWRLPIRLKIAGTRPARRRRPSVWPTCCADASSLATLRWAIRSRRRCAWSRSSRCLGPRCERRCASSRASTSSPCAADHGAAPG